MSTYEDTLLAARFAALAPEPLAGNWDEVLDRAGARKDRGRLWHSRVGQGRHRRLLVVLAVIAFVAVVSASAFAVRAFFIDKGIVGLPPVGATPSTPENGVLDMYYWVHHVETRSRNWVYADGRLIRLGGDQDDGTPLREAANRWSTGFLEQRLTREGVNLLRSEIVSAGGFGHAQRPPDSESLHAVNPPTIQVRKGDRLVPLTWASDLKRLEARLAHPESWLPTSAWKQRKIRAYVPSRFEVCAAVIVNDPPGIKLQQMRPVRIVTLLPAAAQNALRGRDWNARGAEPGWCFAVTTEEARSLAKALDGAGPAKKGGAIGLNYTFKAPGPSRQVWITFGPYLPHGETTCSRCG
jgi:hypothetical protein